MSRIQLLKGLSPLALVLLASPLVFGQCTTESTTSQGNTRQPAPAIRSAPTETFELSAESVDRNNELAIMSLRLNRPTEVESKMVQPGIYMVVVNGDNMTLQNLETNKVVASAPVSWTVNSHIIDNTRLDINTQNQLTKIDIGGTDQAIVLQKAAPNSGATNPSQG